jgi:hypothetical protein
MRLSTSSTTIVGSSRTIALPVAVTFACPMSLAQYPWVVTLWIPPDQNPPAAIGGRRRLPAAGPHCRPMAPTPITIMSNSFKRSVGTRSHCWTNKSIIRIRVFIQILVSSCSFSWFA